MTDPVWTPTAGRVTSSRLNAFIERNARDKRDYRELHRWSVEEPAEFWSAVVEFCGMRLDSPSGTVVEGFERMPGARWFPGATLNYAGNLLQGDGARSAVVFVGEDGERRELTLAELEAQVAAIARALEAQGVGPGDRVAGILPNAPECVVAALATASIGAAWSSCSPDFGSASLLDRLTQIAPKVLFGVDGYRYAGKLIDCLPTLASVARSLPSVTQVIVTHRAGDDRAAGGWPRTQRFAELLADGGEPRYGSFPFDHPLFILFSSGTTGPPKCIVHGAGGTLLQHLKEHQLHSGIGPGDRVFFYTTTGWMMWNWLVSALASGATLVLYDGAPLHPDPGALWRLAASERLTHFGTSARYLQTLEKSGYEPARHHDLGSIEAVLSTGSPLAPASFDYVYRAIGRDLQLASISGGTDIVSCFVLGNPMLPVHRGEVQCRGLGMDVRIFDSDGRAVRGRKGELVCASPFPSMPIGFWNDPDGAAYRRAYFARFPGVWHHGDFAELTEHDGIVMHGRSDATLNPGGVRIGTAEIYRVLEGMREIRDSVVVGQSWDGDTRIVLFVTLADGQALDTALEGRIRGAIRTAASPKHVPAKIVAVGDIPRTLNGKTSERAVSDAIHGREVGNLSALANPDALARFRGLTELAS
jgi:acetoacetyl-CoA synthetase